jgi:signal transduction histidine kinase
MGNMLDTKAKDKGLSLLHASQPLALDGMYQSVQKLYRQTVLALCLALACILILAVLFFSLIHIRGDAKRELTTQASMIASQFAAQGISSDANYILKQAVINPQLAAACILDRKGRIQAAIDGHAYKGETSGLAAFCTEEDHFSFSAIQPIVVHMPIVPPNLPKSIGSVVLVAYTESIPVHMVSALAGLVAIISLFGLTCALLGEKLRLALIRPLRQIASTAQRVSVYKDYSLRITSGAMDTVPSEIASLIESLNAMLAEIEDRDSRLLRKTVELEKSRAGAEAANAAKSQFLANVSHELRTPLNAIIGFSTMIREEQFGKLGNPKYVEYARDIHDSGKHLLDVINDILDLSKAEAGKLTVKFEALQLPKIVDKALHIVAGQAHQARIDIYTDLPPKMPQIVADRVRVVQIMLNLLSNAIKFTPEGGKIVVRVSVEPGRNGVHYFTIEVEDTGIGMSADEIHKAFQTFNQADAGFNRKYEGAGLGLPLTKRLVELHHGKIKIESTKGSGTKVTVRLTSDPALLD